jgi:hypothetical protein
VFLPLLFRQELGVSNSPYAFDISDFLGLVVDNRYAGVMAKQISHLEFASAPFPDSLNCSVNGDTGKPTIEPKLFIADRSGAHAVVHNTRKRSALQVQESAHLSGYARSLQHPHP